MKVLIAFLAAATLAAISAAQAQAPSGNAIPVTVNNFIRAETDMYFGNMSKDGGFWKVCSQA